LRNPARGSHSREVLFLIEAVIPNPPRPDWAITLDITMLALLHGRERTRKECEKLLAGAGLRLDRVIDVGQSTAILEAVPI
jgi:hypothetical protein